MISSVKDPTIKKALQFLNRELKKLRGEVLPDSKTKTEFGKGGNAPSSDYVPTTGDPYFGDQGGGTWGEGDLGGPGTIGGPTTTPMNKPVPKTLATPVLHNDGSAVITLEWSYVQGGNPANGFIIFYDSGSSAPGTLSEESKSVKVSVSAVTHRFLGLEADQYYRFGIAAYKTVGRGMAIGPIMDVTSWRSVLPASTPTIKDMDVDGILQNKGILIFE